MAFGYDPYNPPGLGRRRPQYQAQDLLYRPGITPQPTMERGPYRPQAGGVGFELLSSQGLGGMVAGMQSQNAAQGIGSQGQYGGLMPAQRQSIRDAYSQQQLGGLQGALGNLQRINASYGLRSQYQPSQGQLPDVSATYSRGGAFGRTAGEPTRYNPAINPNYGTGGVGLMPAPANAQEYGQQMAVQNPGGRSYGGLLPAMGTSASGAQRPIWMAPPAQAGPQVGPQQMQAYAQAHRGYANPTTGTISGNPNVANMTPQEIQAAQIVGRGPGQKSLSYYGDAGLLAQNRQNYQQGLAARQGAARNQTLDRVAVRNQAAQERQQQAYAAAQQQQLYGLMQRDPRLAMQYAQMQNQNAIAQQELGLRGRQLTQQGTLGQQQSADRRYVADAGLQAAQHNAWAARYGEAIKAGNSPDDAARLAGPPPGSALTQPQAAPQMGLMAGANRPAGNAGYKPKKQLLDSQIAEIAKLPVEQRANALRAIGVSNPTDLYYYQKQLDPTHGTKEPPVTLGAALQEGAGYLGAGLLNPFFAPFRRQPARPTHTVVNGVPQRIEPPYSDYSQMGF